MVNPCPDGFCLTYNYDDPYDGVKGRTHDACYKNRPIYAKVIQSNGTYREVWTGAFRWGWHSEFIDRVGEDGDDSYALLKDLKDSWDDWAGSKGYFTIDDETRSRCFSLAPPPVSSPFLSGTASPPPPGNKNMCCDCNTIATIVEDKIIRQNEAIKDHIDRRTREELQVINKMLQGMNIKLDLQPVIDRLNQVEANLWNGAGN
jgi:hypothetical protein